MSMEAVAASSADPTSLVDLERYPILALDSPAGKKMIAAAQAQLREMGAAELSDFIRPAAMAELIRDARALAPGAYCSRGASSPYLEVPDFNLPADHPRRMFGPFSVGVIAYDQFPPSSPLRQLYESEALMAFVAAVLDRGPLYRYADPLGALNLAVMTDGDELEWHFDQTDFVVSLAIQDADTGGDFEVAPRVRSATDERYDEVRKVLEGRSDEVVTLPMTPGTLLIFEGRYSIHRVSPIAGSTPRLVGLLAYDTKPGTNSTEVLKLSRYGRVG